MSKNFQSPKIMFDLLCPIFIAGCFLILKGDMAYYIQPINHYTTQFQDMKPIKTPGMFLLNQ